MGNKADLKKGRTSNSRFLEATSQICKEDNIIEVRTNNTAWG